MQEEATNALELIRGTSDNKQELDDMIDESNLEKSQKKFSIFQLFRSRALLFPTVISIVLHLSQQLSGINAVIYFLKRNKKFFFN